MPYIEQQNLFNKFVFTGGSGWGTANNYTASSNAKIPTYLCPSSPVGNVAPSPFSGTNIPSNHYVAVTGAAPNAAIGFTEARSNQGNTGTAGSCSGGIASAGGALVPGSPRSQTESSSLALRTNLSPWVALHPASLRRSYPQLHQAKPPSDGDSHPADS